MGKARSDPPIANGLRSFYLEMDGQRSLHSLVSVQGLLQWDDNTGRAQACVEIGGAAQGQILLLARSPWPPVDSGAPHAPWTPLSTTVEAGDLCKCSSGPLTMAPRRG